MNSFRKIPFLSFVVSPYKKAKINLSGCNFDCRGCFAIAKQEKGRRFLVEELVDLLIKTSRRLYGEMVNDVQMTGGEPTIDRDYLISLIIKLRELNVEKIGISTNGYLLDRSLAEELKSLNVNYIKLDIKAYTDTIHKWYTGKSNVTVLKALKLLNRYGLNFYVRTIYIPELINPAEIANIARFIGEVNRNIPYKIYQFAPEQLDDTISRAPTQEEMAEAFSAAKGYLDDAAFYTTETAYKPEPYKCVEVRADGLLEEFKRIDKICKAVIKEWNMEYFTMNEVLNSPERT